MLSPIPVSELAASFYPTLATRASAPRHVRRVSPGLYNVGNKLLERLEAVLHFDALTLNPPLMSRWERDF